MDDLVWDFAWQTDMRRQGVGGSLVFIIQMVGQE